VSFASDAAETAKAQIELQNETTKAQRRHGGHRGSLCKL